jgi:hypothetical protein
VKKIEARIDGSAMTIRIEGKVASMRVEFTPAPAGGIHVISSEPAMPDIAMQISAGGALVGDVTVTFVANDCPPNGPAGLRTAFTVPGGGPGPLEFGDVVVGGSLGARAEGVVNGCPVGASGGADIGGTNPARAEIQAALPHRVLRAVACRESGLRQFDAPPDGGTGRCPLFGKCGEVGIMGIHDPGRDEVWNWRRNVARGIERFDRGVLDARLYPADVRSTDKFAALVSNYNQHERLDLGLPEIRVELPDFAEGDFDDDLRELELDAIRGYNGWTGSDLFGFPVHEFRVAVTDRVGVTMVRVVDVDEVTLTGRAVWERVPATERSGAACHDPDYVNQVLALLHGCADDAQPEIKSVRLMSDDYSETLDWNRHVIGYSRTARRVNIQIDATDVDLDFIFIEVQSSTPNMWSPDASIPQIHSIDPAEKYAVPRTHGGDTGPSTYRLSIEIDLLDRVRAASHTVATIVRSGGTSDWYFRRGLGYASRGGGMIPFAGESSTGKEEEEVPDALRVLETGGVEVLRVRLVDLPADVSVVESERHRLIWSPAEIVYISCHGHYEQNCLSGDGGQCWTDSTSLDLWREATRARTVGAVPGVADVPGSPRVLVIAGCSVMELNPGSIYFPPYQGPGRAWIRLMFAYNSYLTVILGYGKTRNLIGQTITAPADDPVGNSIASQMAPIIASSPDLSNLALRWMQVNQTHRAWGAVAADESGYWLFIRNWNFKHEIHGPIPLDPGELSTLNRAVRRERWNALLSRIRWWTNLGVGIGRRRRS